MTRTRLYVFFSLAAFLAASVSFTHAETQKHQPKAAQIDKNGVMILIRSTLIALDQGNKTGNYTVLRDIAAPGFAASNNPARLAEIFANLRREKVDLSGVLVLEPQLTTLPELDERGMMHFAGVFPSVPLQVNFELLFAAVDGQWRLFGVSTNLGSATPTAPPAPEAANTPKPSPTAERKSVSSAPGPKPAPPAR